jgi:hypothetical protein
MRPASQWRLAVAIASCLVSILLTLPAVAGAAETSEYAPEAVDRSFSSGTGGWTNSSSFDGSCVPPLLCPTIANSFQGAGGADGNGFVRSAFTGVAGVLGVAGAASGIWESPQFTYLGAAGQTPSSVRFTISRQASVDQLLAAAGNSADYSVQLVDLSAGGSSLPLIDHAAMAGAATWVAVPAVAVNPTRLTMGDRYKIKITSTYTTGTSVLVTGNADYDEVVLQATTAGAGGGNEGGVGRGTGSLANAQLHDLMSGALGSNAVLKGNRILVRVRCPAKVGRACRVALQGMLRKHKAATSKRKARIAKGRSKRIVLRVKPKARPKLAMRKRLLFRLNVRAGKAKTTVYKNLKLIRRR